MSHDVSPLLTSANEQEPSSNPSADADGLTQSQHNAINRLLEGAADSTVATDVGVSRRTIYRWKHQDEAFMAELQRRRNELNDEHTDRLRALLGKALDVFDRQVRDRYGPVCYRAARTLLTLTGLGKTLGLKPNVEVQSPTAAPLPKAQAPAEMSAKTMRAMMNAVKTIDLLNLKNAPAPAAG